MPTTKTTRFNHENCKHARTGAEGKKARAACRKQHAEEAKKTTARKPAAAKAATTPRKRAVKKQPVASVPTPVVDELADADI